MTIKALETIIDLFQRVQFSIGDEQHDLFGEESLENHKRYQEAYRQVRELYEAICGRDV